MPHVKWPPSENVGPRGGYQVGTDAEGRFQWDESPVGGVRIPVIREGFESISRFGSIPQGQSHSSGL